MEPGKLWKIGRETKLGPGYPERGTLAPAPAEGGIDTCERLQGAAVVPGQDPQQLRQGGGGRGGGQHPAVQHLQVSQRNPLKQMFQTNARVGIIAAQNVIDVSAIL